MRIPFFFKKKKKEQLFTVGFYNLENLFDPENNRNTLNSDFTPSGQKKWTKQRYQKKLKNLSRTIANIGKPDNNYSPVLVGVAEAQSKTVLQDLLNTGPLKLLDMDFVHFDSPDERGIDTGLLYNKKYVKIKSAEPLTLLVHSNEGVRDTTRDILYVELELNGEPMALFVNHWPSRREGNVLTEHKRIAAAAYLRQKIVDISQEKFLSNVIVMGDFNDDPSSASLRTLLKDTNLYNPMQKLHIPLSRGTSSYKGNWNLFDQIILSNSFFNIEQGTHSFDKAAIYDHSSLKEKSGKYKGTPFRTYISDRYLGGYSDHFPVFIILKYH